MSEFLIFVSFRKYDRVLKMRQDAIMEGFWIFQDSKYARFLRMQALPKVLNMPEYGWIMPYMVVEIGNFDKHFVKNKRKEAPRGNILEFFLQDTLEATFWMKNLIQRWTQSGPFFRKSGHIFWFSNRAGKPLVARLWLWLNMHQYPWISLNILENAWVNNCSDYARILKVQDHFACSADFWRWLWF